jgi:hypothetical protein
MLPGGYTWTLVQNGEERVGDGMEGKEGEEGRNKNAPFSECGYAIVSPISIVPLTDTFLATGLPPRYTGYSNYTVYFFRAMHRYMTT